MGAVGRLVVSPACTLCQAQSRRVGRHVRHALLVQAGRGGVSGPPLSCAHVCKWHPIRCSAPVLGERQPLSLVHKAAPLQVGGRLSSYFDEDPKRWRMIAEFITTLGLALEIATQISPSKPNVQDPTTSHAEKCVAADHLHGSFLAARWFLQQPLGVHLPS